MRSWKRLLALALEFIEEPRDGDVEFGMYLTPYPTTRSHGSADNINDEDQS